MIRVCQFTDTAEWYAGSKSKDGPFRQPLDEWAAQIGRAHSRPVQGFEFDDLADDPRTGTLVHDPVVAPEPHPLDTIRGMASGGAKTNALIDYLKGV